jgi:mannosidase alpha-like ER degradation enhancer 1
LLFDEENPLHNDDSNYIFTTEGHILSLEQKYLKLPSATVRRLRRAENPQCPAYEPPYFIGADDMPGLFVGIRSRADFDYARFLISTALSDGDETWWHPNGWCTVPVVDLYVSYLHTPAQLAVEISAISPRHRSSSSRQMAK